MPVLKKLIGQAVEKEINGNFKDFPHLNEKFIFQTGDKVLRTSLVQVIMEANESYIKFKTLNSIYILHF